MERLNYNPLYMSKSKQVNRLVVMAAEAIKSAKEEELL